MGMNSSLFEHMDEAIDIINKSSKIFIASHVNPDGDNIGSSLSLALALKKIDKEVFVLSSDGIPDDFRFLPGCELIQDYKESMGPIDLLIAVDSSDIGRLGKNKDLIMETNKVINIDHHISNTKFGHINIVNPKASATGELIYYFIKRLNIEIDKDIATNIYTAINTDTGKFSYDNVTSDTHRIAADLLDAGVDIKEVNINIYENSSMERTNLFIKTLSGLETYSNNKIAIAKISQDMLTETNTRLEDTEGIVSFIRGIGPVEVSCILKEISEKEVRVSLRSKEYVDVASICEVFNGGGHIRAAGCTINSDLNSAESLIVEEIIKKIR